MTPEEIELRTRLEEIKAKEVRAYKRATLYTLIPVLAGAIVFGIFVWQTIQLEHRKEDLTREYKTLESETNALKLNKEQATKELEQLNQELDKSNQALDQARQAMSDAKTQLEQGKRPENVVKELDTTLRTIEKVAGKGQDVVIGGYDSLAGAQAQARRAQRAGYAKVVIYLRQNSYRTVIRFSSEAEAKAKYPDIRDQLSSSAYLRDVDKWCQNPQQQNGFIQCSN